MKRFMAVSGAILRKDCRELWPQAVPTAALVAVATASSSSYSTWFMAVMLLAVVFLITILTVRLIQSDSSVSVRHDWLTRPIPWMTLLVAKAAFMILWIAVPDALGGTVKGLIRGYSLGEALLEGVQQSVPSAALLGVIVAAVITASIWQAMLVLVGAVILYQCVLAFVMLREEREGWLDLAYVASSGTAWVTQWALGMLVMVAGVLILWRQYGGRRTGQARTIFAGLVALFVPVSVLLLPASRTFAVQRQLGSDPAAAAQVAVELLPGCFAAKLAEGPAGFTAKEVSFGRVPAVPGALLKAAGLDAVAFSTVLTEREPAGDGHLILGYPTARYVDAAGRTLFTVRGFPATPQLSATADGRTALSHNWLLPRGHYERLAARSDVRLQIDYSLSLLVPKAQVVVPTDGRREFYPGLGYCGAQPQDGSKSTMVDCFKAGPQPALLLVNEVGAVPSAGKGSGAPDFTPAILGVLAGRRYQVAMEPSSVPRSRVQITAYEARAHFERRVTSPGILGGSKATCPAPEAAGM